jgi:hypothetical protein
MCGAWSLAIWWSLLVVQHKSCAIVSYGMLLLDMCKVVPDGIVCFFVSYGYMEHVVNEWAEQNIIGQIREHKLIFVETQVSPLPRRLLTAGV